MRGLKARLLKLERMTKGAPRVPRKPAKLVAPALAVEVVIPLRVVSELNRRDHWTARHRRNKAADLAWRVALGRFAVVGFHPPYRVTLTRLGGRQWDDDNNVSGLKHCRDLVAAWLKYDDGDPAIAWRCEQSPGGNHHGVLVRVECGGGTGA